MKRSVENKSVIWTKVQLNRERNCRKNRRKMEENTERLRKKEH